MTTLNNTSFIKRFVCLALVFCLSVEASSTDVFLCAVTIDTPSDGGSVFSQSALSPWTLLERSNPEPPRESFSLRLAAAIFLGFALVTTVADPALMVAQGKAKGPEVQRTALVSATSQFDKDWSSLQAAMTEAGNNMNLNQALADKASASGITVELLNEPQKDTLRQIAQTIALSAASDPKLQEALKNLSKSHDLLNSAMTDAQTTAGTLNSPKTLPMKNAIEQAENQAAGELKTSNDQISQWQLQPDSPIRSIYKSKNGTTLVKASFTKGLVTVQYWIVNASMPSSDIVLNLDQGSFEFDVTNKMVTKIQTPKVILLKVLKTGDELTHYLASEFDIEKMATTLGEIANLSDHPGETAPDTASAAPPADLSPNPDAPSTSSKTRKKVTPASGPSVNASTQNEIALATRFVNEFFREFGNTPEKFTEIPPTAADGVEVLNNDLAVLPDGNEARRRVEQTLQEFAVVKDLIKQKAQCQAAEQALDAYNLELKTKPKTPTALEKLLRNYTELGSLVSEVASSQDKTSKALRDHKSPNISAGAKEIQARSASIAIQFKKIPLPQQDVSTKQTPGSNVMTPAPAAPSTVPSSSSTDLHLRNLIVNSTVAQALLQQAPSLNADTLTKYLTGLYHSTPNAVFPSDKDIQTQFELAAPIEHSIQTLVSKDSNIPPDQINPLLHVDPVLLALKDAWELQRKYPSDPTNLGVSIWLVDENITTLGQPYLDATKKSRLIDKPPVASRLVKQAIEAALGQKASLAKTPTTLSMLAFFWIMPFSFRRKIFYSRLLTWWSRVLSPFRYRWTRPLRFAA